MLPTWAKQPHGNANEGCLTARGLGDKEAPQAVYVPEARVHVRTWEVAGVVWCGSPPGHRSPAVSQLQWPTPNPPPLTWCVGMPGQAPIAAFGGPLAGHIHGQVTTRKDRHPGEQRAPHPVSIGAWDVHDVPWASVG